MRSLRFAALLALLAFGPTSAPAATSPLSPDANQAFLADNAKKQGVMVRPSGLQYRILRGGCLAVDDSWTLGAGHVFLYLEAPTGPSASRNGWIERRAA